MEAANQSVTGITIQVVCEIESLASEEPSKSTPYSVLRINTYFTWGSPHANYHMGCSSFPGNNHRRSTQQTNPAIHASIGPYLILFGQPYHSQNTKTYSADLLVSTNNNLALALTTPSSVTISASKNHFLPCRLLTQVLIITTYGVGINLRLDTRNSRPIPLSAWPKHLIKQRCQNPAM